MQDKNFDNELDDLLLGISKIQEYGDSMRSHSNSFGDENSSENKSNKSRKLNVAEATRQAMRPEAAVWLGFAALISASKLHSVETKKLASKLGGHLARRRARSLGSKYGIYHNISVSPRCRKVIGTLFESGCEIQEVFGVWIRMKGFLSSLEVSKISGCFWPAINCIEKENQTDILIPRFPERMPVIIAEKPNFGSYVKISEDGELSFIFWMDDGISDLPEVCGLGWLPEGLFPLIRDD